jgi:hypothetical protein
VSDLIYRTLYAQAAKHGQESVQNNELKRDDPAVEVKVIKSSELGEVRWYFFKTQGKGLGQHFEANQVGDDLKAKLAHPLPTKLSGLTEIVCGQYMGEIYIIQEPRVGRKYEAQSTAVLYISAKDVVPGICELIPAEIAPLGELLDSCVVDGVPRPNGTFYLLGFPLWKEGHPKESL